MSKNKGVTAAELMTRLQSDPEWVRQNKEREVLRKGAVEQYRLAVAGVVDDLSHAGFPVQSIDELRKSGTPYETAVPILLQWLPLLKHMGAKDSIVRALSVPWARPMAAIPLIAEFRAISDDPTGLKWTIGNALEVLADDSVFEEIAELVQNKQHGKSREMLALALGKMLNPRAVDLLIDLLDDDEVVGHAVMALGKLKAEKARSQIERLVNHPKAWVRKEAKKSLAKLNKEE